MRQGVGSATFGSGFRGLVEHWNGRRWGALLLVGKTGQRYDALFGTDCTRLACMSVGWNGTVNQHAWALG